jgi:hypothetical protein
MVVRYGPEIHIVFPEMHQQGVLEHCHRALAAFRDGRTEEGKAFGLVFGTVSDTVVTVANCFPLRKNVRSQQPLKEYMDRVMAEHAVVSQTPFEQRGWVADPAELFARIRECRLRNQILLGTYHMHRVGWQHDPARDTPTRLDRVLAEDSGLLMFIVSMVRPDQPVIRAFYEGKMEKELGIRW